MCVIKIIGLFSPFIFSFFIFSFFHHSLLFLILFHTKLFDNLQHLDNGHSPQAQYISSFVSKYMRCEAELSLILSINWIHKNTNELKKKFSTRELFCGTLERLQSAIGLGGASSEATTPNTKRIERRKSFTDKKPSEYKEKENYLDLIVTSDSSLSMDHRHHHKTSSSTSTISTSTSSSLNIKKDKATNTNYENSASSNVNIINNNKIEKDKKEFLAQSDDLISLENEEYARYVENYEQKINEKENIPTSILKQTKTKKKSNNSNPIVKPNTILSLEDRDIVVIDKADINESVSVESEVIVVDNSRMQKEVDLIEILGSNWPSSAGDAALVLNNIDSTTGTTATTTINKLSGGSSASSSASSYNVRCERNKSGNPISHLVSSKVTDKRNKEYSKSLSEQSSFEKSKYVIDSKITKIYTPV